MGNKAMKIKVTNMLIGKETNERKNRYAKLNRGRKRRFVSIKKLTARGKEEQEKQRNKCRKNNNRLKKLKLKEKKRKGILHRTAKAQWRGRCL